MLTLFSPSVIAEEVEFPVALTGPGEAINLIPILVLFGIPVTDAVACASLTLSLTLH